MCDKFTFDNVKLVVQAIADHLKKTNKVTKGILIGYDNRFLSDEFALVAASVFMGNSIPVKMMALPSPTPMIAQAIAPLSMDGAVMFTASHNPAKYNGIKFIPKYGGPANVEITRSIEEELERIILSGSAPSESQDKTLLSTVDTSDLYIESLAKLVDLSAIKKARLKIGFDPMFGVGARPMEKLLELAGCKVWAINTERDPLFGMRLPEPSDENLIELKALIKTEGLKVGLALDGDADRFGIITEEGSFLTANQVISILALHLLLVRKMTGRLVRTVATTHLIDEIAKKMGVKVVETPVGFKYIASEMLKGDVLIGGEESGGLSILGHVPEKDGLLACLLILEVLARSGKTLSKILGEIYEEFGTYHNVRLDICGDKDNMSQVLSMLKADPPSSFGGHKVTEIILIDGIKLILEDGSWLLFRASGTEPLVRAYIESRSQASYNNLKREAAVLFER